MTLVHKIVFTLGVLSLGFVGGYASRPAQPVQAAVAQTQHWGETPVSAEQFAELKAMQQKANDDQTAAYAQSVIEGQQAEKEAQEKYYQGLAKQEKNAYGLIQRDQHAVLMAARGHKHTA